MHLNDGRKHTRAAGGAPLVIMADKCGSLLRIPPFLFTGRCRFFSSRHQGEDPANVANKLASRGGNVSHGTSARSPDFFLESDPLSYFLLFFAITVNLATLAGIKKHLLMLVRGFVAEPLSMLAPLCRRRRQTSISAQK